MSATTETAASRPTRLDALRLGGVAAVVAQQQGAQDEHASIVQALADLEQLSADDVHTLLAVEGEESDRHEASC